MSFPTLNIGDLIAKTPIVQGGMGVGISLSRLASAVANEGGIGVIHKNMSIADQARQVHTVKRAENGMIYDPVTIRIGSCIGEALQLMQEYHIH